MSNPIVCPHCRIVTSDEHTSCHHCGCDYHVLVQVLEAAEDSIRLALESLREQRHRDALDYAYEAWGLKHTVSTAAIGLVVAVSLQDSAEITRWLRRRKLVLRSSA